MNEPGDRRDPRDDRVAEHRHRPRLEADRAVTETPASAFELHHFGAGSPRGKTTHGQSYVELDVPIVRRMRRPERCVMSMVSDTARSPGAQVSMYEWRSASLRSSGFLGDVAAVALREHAPAAAVPALEAVDLEGDGLVGDTGGQHTGGSPHDDGVTNDGVVDREHHREVVDDEAHAADIVSFEQRPTFFLRQDLQSGATGRRFVFHAAIVASRGRVAKGSRQPVSSPLASGDRRDQLPASFR